MRAALENIAATLTGGAVSAQDLPWPSLRYQHTQMVRTALAERFSPANANKHLAALRGVLKEAWRLGLLNGEDYQRAVDLEGVRGSRLPPGRSLSDGEILALFEACGRDTTAAGVRDAALLAILYGCGLRRAEAAGLDVSDYDAPAGELRVRQAKGRKDRKAFPSGGARAALDDWLAVRSDEPGALFCPVNRGGRIAPRRMTDQAIYNALRKRSLAAGVPRFSPHDLRRTFTSNLIDVGVDLVTVQGLVGHSKIDTTAKYDRRGEQVRKCAAGVLHVPYVAHVAIQRSERATEPS